MMEVFFVFLSITTMTCACSSILLQSVPRSNLSYTSVKFESVVENNFYACPQRVSGPLETYVGPEPCMGVLLRVGFKGCELHPNAKNANLIVVGLASAHSFHLNWSINEVSVKKERGNTPFRVIGHHRPCHDVAGCRFFPPALKK